MLKKAIGPCLVVAFAVAFSATQAKACPCGHEKTRVVSYRTYDTCDTCYKPTFCERLCCHVHKPKCGCGSYAYGYDYYSRTPTYYDTYDYYGARYQSEPTYSSSRYYDTYPTYTTRYYSSPTYSHYYRYPSPSSRTVSYRTYD